VSAALQRIEAMYRGEVGAAYAARMRHAQLDRSRFWSEVLDRTDPDSLLEVGCGTGLNLKCLAGRVPSLHGCDVSAAALEEAKYATGGLATLTQASVGALPYRDQSFDVVASVGVLIHTPEEDLLAVLRELARVSSRYVLLVEYEDSHRRSIDWRGIKDALWADAFSIKFWQANPHYVPIWRKDVDKADGFDRCHAALFERRGAMSLPKVVPLFRDAETRKAA